MRQIRTSVPEDNGGSPGGRLHRRKCSSVFSLAVKRTIVNTLNQTRGPAQAPAVTCAFRLRLAGADRRPGGGRGGRLRLRRVRRSCAIRREIFVARVPRRCSPPEELNELPGKRSSRNTDFPARFSGKCYGRVFAGGGCLPASSMTGSPPFWLICRCGTGKESAGEGACAGRLPGVCPESAGGRCGLRLMTPRPGRGEASAARSPVPERPARNGLHRPLSGGLFPGNGFGEGCRRTTFTGNLRRNGFRKTTSGERGPSVPFSRFLLAPPGACSPPGRGPVRDPVRGPGRDPARRLTRSAPFRLRRSSPPASSKVPLSFAPPSGEKRGCRIGGAGEILFRNPSIHGGTTPVRRLRSQSTDGTAAD